MQKSEVEIIPMFMSMRQGKTNPAQAIARLERSREYKIKYHGISHLLVSLQPNV